MSPCAAFVIVSAAGVAAVVPAETSQLVIGAPLPIPAPFMDGILVAVGDIVPDMVAAIVAGMVAAPCAVAGKEWLLHAPIRSTINIVKLSMNRRDVVFIKLLSL